MESTVVAAGMVYVSLRPASVYTWTLAGMVISVAVPMCVLWRRYLRRAAPIQQVVRNDLRVGIQQATSGTEQQQRNPTSRQMPRSERSFER
jgi:hypothetical protein